jgi:hypothetical protein
LDVLEALSFRLMVNEHIVKMEEKDKEEKGLASVILTPAELNQM